MGDVPLAGTVHLCGWIGWQAFVTATLRAFSGRHRRPQQKDTACGRHRCRPMVPFLAAGAISAILLTR